MTQLNDKSKTLIIVLGMLLVFILQLVAWQTGHNGQVFALTSAVIGGSIGYVLGIKLMTKQ